MAGRRERADRGVVRSTAVGGSRGVVRSTDKRKEIDGAGEWGNGRMGEWIRTQ
jgi:hypothetical protein